MTPADEIDAAYNAEGGLKVTPIHDWIGEKKVTRALSVVHERIEDVLRDIEIPRTHWMAEDLHGWYVSIQECLVSRP